MPVYVCVHGRAAGAALFHAGPFLVQDTAGRRWACWEAPRLNLAEPESPEEADLWVELTALCRPSARADWALLPARLECAGPADLPAPLGDLAGCCG